MKKLMISLAALTAIGSAVPAAAQTWTYGAPRYVQAPSDHYHRMTQRLVSMSRQIDTAASHRQITPAQAQRLRRDLRTIAFETNRLGRNGLNSREDARLTAQLERVSRRMNQYRYPAPYRYAYQVGPNFYDRGWYD